jgi:hypothetical protein
MFERLHIFFQLVALSILSIGVHLCSSKDLSVWCGLPRALFFKMLKF